MKFKCRCGNMLRDQLIPNPISFRIVSDIDLEKAGDLINADDLFERSSQALQCDNCGRLWVYWKNRDGEVEEYVRMDAEGRIVESPPPDRVGVSK